MEGLLPENAKAHSLCQAFNREKMRRNKAGGHTAQEAEKKAPALSVKTETKETDFAVAKNNMPARMEGEEKAKADWPVKILKLWCIWG